MRHHGGDPGPVAGFVMGNNPSHFKEAGDNAPVEYGQLGRSPRVSSRKLNSLERVSVPP